MYDTSPASASHSSNGIFGFGQVNQKGDAFTPKTLSCGTVFGSSTPTGISNSSTWAFTSTSSPLSFGSPTYAGSGSSTSALGYSSSGNFGSPSVFMQWNQRGDSLAPKSLDTPNVCPSPTNSHTWTFNQTSSPLSAPTSFGTPSSYCLGSLTSGGANATRSTFDLKQSHFGGQERGSRIANYKITPETEYSAEKLVSISAMSAYEDKSHEELRWGDYKFTKKGGFVPSCSAVKSTSLSLSPFSSSPVNKICTNLWGTTSVSTTPMTHNPFGKSFQSVTTATPMWNFPGPTSTSKPLPPFSSTAVTSAPLNSFNPFLPRKDLPSPASTASTAFKSPTFTSPGCTSPSWSLAPLNQNPFTNPFTSLSTMSSSSFSSPTFPPFITPPSLSGFWPTPIVTAPVNSVSSSPVSSGLGSTFNQPTTLFPSSANTSPSWSLAPLNQNPLINPFTSLPSQTCSLSISGPTSAAFTPGVVTIRSSLDDFWSTSIGGPSISMVTAPANSVSGSPFNQPTTLFKPCVPSTQKYNEAITGSIGQITSTDQPSSAPTPFGTLPPKSHLSFQGSSSMQSIQYGISSIPVKDKSAPVRYPMLTTRHLFRRSKLPVRKYDPKLNDSKVPYFSVTKEIPVAVFVPRENPRALVITRNMHEQRFSDSIYEKQKDDIKDYVSSDNPTIQKNMLPTVVDVPSKLQLPDYYTKPQISELEEKERAEPGFCSRVNDFVIGRHGYGCIKFLGETDVRNLDLETYVQFNNREVIVYMDDTKKPPVGQGLNKPAEITLLNIKCIDKRTGAKYKDGSKIDKYTEMLKKKVVAQGGEFVSYDPVEGEWKFRVQHF